MRTFAPRLCLSLFVITAASAQSPLERDITARIAKFEGRVTLHAKNLKTGAEFDRNGGNRVITASSIKLPIMIGVYTAVAAGRAKWTDTSTLTKENKVPGSGVLQEMSDGAVYNLRDLLRFMILLSDNTATNLVLDHVPGNDVNRVMDQLGAKNTRSLRKILSRDNSPHGVSDAGRDPELAKYGIGVTTPREMVGILEKLHKGEIVSKDASAEMLDIMKKQQGREGMPRRFQGVDVADKPGALNQFRGDVGIVFSKDGPVAISIACEEIPKADWTVDNPAYLLIADLSRMLVDGLR